YDSVGVVAHQLERLEPQSRVLERERVEGADHADVARVVDRRDDLGLEARRAVEDDVVARRAEQRIHLAEELGVDGARLVRTGRGYEHVHAARMRHYIGIELV